MTLRELALGVARLAFILGTLLCLAAIGGLAAVVVWSANFSRGFALVCSGVAIVILFWGLVVFFQTGGYRRGSARFSSPRDWDARAPEERRAKELQAAGLLAVGVLFFALAILVG